MLSVQNKLVLGHVEKCPAILRILFKTWGLLKNKIKNTHNSIHLGNNFVQLLNTNISPLLLTHHTYQTKYTNTNVQLFNLTLTLTSRLRND